MLITGPLTAICPRPVRAPCSAGILPLAGRFADSGGSIEWLRGSCEPELSYAQLEELLAGVSFEPSGIIYYPFLSGSGARGRILTGGFRV